MPGRLVSVIIVTSVVACLGAYVLAGTPAVATSSPATALSAATFTGWAGATDNPTTPGYHKLVCKWQFKGQSREMPFVLYIPEGYGPGNTKLWPLLVFLSGMGERGSDPAAVMNCGIPVDLTSTPEVLKWLPMLMIFPLCSNETTWDEPEMAAMTVQLIRHAAAHWPVDSNRIYVTGLSMGGRGCWAVAREAPTLFAAVAPLVSRELEPSDTAKRVAGGGTTFLVISGMADEKSEPDSRKMVDALREKDVDVVYAPVPRAGHFLWPQYYSSREFYEWLLLHERGKAPPAGRAPAEHLIGLFFQGAKGTQAFQDKLQADFGKFAQYWFVDNCAPRAGVGPLAEFAGQKNVFVTHPLAADVACRLQTTTKIPTKCGTYLRFKAGHKPKGEWELIVRVNELEGIRTMVNDQTAKDGWLDVSYDLTPWGNSEVRIQIVQQSDGWLRKEGYWADLRIESLAAQPPKEIARLLQTRKHDHSY